jgi:OOP family OmpA-OmpF porin
MRTYGFALGALLIGMSGVAIADDHGFYADVGVGVASYPIDMRGQLNGVAYVHDGRTNDFTYSFAAGYRFNRYIGVELGFADFGNPTVNLGNPADPEKSVGRARFSAQGKTFAVLTHVPMGAWDSFFRVGVLQATFATRHYIRQGTTEFHYFASEERPSVFLGVGSRYALAEQWALSLSVDYYNRVAQADWANLISPRIGFSYRF